MRGEDCFLAFCGSNVHQLMMEGKMGIS